MKQTEIRFNIDGLEEFRKQMGDSYRARVGILAGKAERTGGKGEKLNNAELGVIQMFGSNSKKIPPRDFLLFPLQFKKRDILGAMTSRIVKTAIDIGDYKKVFQLLGQKGRAVVLEAFATSGFGQWAPNKPATIARKKSDKPLIDTAQLERAIDTDVIAKGGGALPGRQG